MFENFGTLIGSIGFFGNGIYLILFALVFAIARGVTKDSSDLILIMITMFGIGGMIFIKDPVHTSLFVTSAVLIIIWFWWYLTKWGGEND